MKAWGATKSQNGALKAQSIFDDMVLRYSQGDIDLKPDIVKYNTLIDAWANAGEPERAEAIFRLLEQSGLKPDHRTYGTMIKAWGGSKSYNGGLKAQSIFDDMVLRYSQGDIDLKASIVTYNTLINAWANAGVPEQAEAIFRLMGQSGLKPDVISYNILVKAWSNAGRPDGENVHKQFMIT